MDHNLTTWALSEFFCGLMVFARLAGFLHFMPGVSEMYVPQRVRLSWALALTLVIAPVVQDHCPAMPQHSFSFLLLVFQEAVIGMIAGILLKIVMSTFELVGGLYGYQTGLANTFAMSPATSQQTGLPSAFLGSLIVALLFVLDIHHHFLRGFVKSYDLFSPQDLPSFTDLSSALTQMVFKAVSASFMMALHLSASIVILGFVLLLMSGLLGRLVPQIQIFFVLQPVQIFVGFLILILSLSMMMRQFVDFFEQFLLQLWGASGLRETFYG